jgi:transposase
MTESEIEQLFKVGSCGQPLNSKPQADWGWIHKEMRKKGVTLRLLWEEYKNIHPDGYELSRFYELYKQWRMKLNVTFRQTYKAGEKMFVDYAGQTVPVTDRHTGTVKEAQVFVAVLAASNYSYAEATWDQTLHNWIESHVRAFEFFGGVPQIIIPDNLKAGVSKACRYEPDMNPTYHDMAVHYGAVVIPARVRKPKDKAKVETGVLIVERWILASLRNRTFFSIGELNKAISELLGKLNTRSFQKMEGSRLSWFEGIERETLMPLPQSRYVLAEWKKARVNIDYHMELNRHYYSVPYQLVHEEVETRYTSTTVEIFRRGKRVASHKRDDTPGRYTTLMEHMPKSHQQYLEWTPSRIIRWAGTIGKSAASVMETIMETRRHPEQGYRACLGIMRLGKRYSEERLEAACERAIVIGGYSYKSVQSILERGLDRIPLPNKPARIRIDHSNIRGQRYYGEGGN